MPPPRLQMLGNQLGGQTLQEDVWFLNTRYHTAVVHQKEAWLAVNKKLSEVFQKVKQLLPVRYRS